MEVAYATFFSVIGFVLVVSSVAFGMQLLDRSFKFQPDKVNEFNLKTFLVVVFVFCVGATFASFSSYTFAKHFQEMRCSKT